MPKPSPRATACSPRRSTASAWGSLGFTLALTLIGLIRELIGAGTLFSQASLLLGPNFAFLETTVLPDYGGVLMMVLPPAGFLVLGLLLAAKRLYERRAARAAEAVSHAVGCH